MDVQAFVEYRDLTLNFNKEGEEDESKILKVTVDPSVMTAELEAELERGDEESTSLMIESMAGLIVSWDLVMKGKKVPPTVAGLRKVPIVALLAIMQGIGQEISEQTAEEGKISAAT